MLLGWVLVCVAMVGSYVLFVGRGRGRTSALHRLDERFVAENSVMMNTRRSARRSCRCDQHAVYEYCLQLLP